MRILLCNTVFEIDHIYPFVLEYCKDYLYDGDRDSDYCICIRESDLLFEREKSRNEDIKEGKQIREFGFDYLEILAVYRKICACLLERNILLFHGSVVSKDGVGYLFTAKSGTGKSTHTRFWREYFDDAIMINDDKPLLEIKNDGVIVYGTPWDGKHRLSTNTCVPLKSICILHRGSENSISRISSSSAYPMLLQQVNRPVGNVSGMKKTLELVDELCKQVEFYSLYCTMDVQAAKIAYEGMK